MNAQISTKKLDLCYVLFSNKPILKYSPNSIAEKLLVPVHTLLQKFKKQYPDISWDPTKSVKELLLGTSSKTKIHRRKFCNQINGILKDGLFIKVSSSFTVDSLQFYSIKRVFKYLKIYGRRHVIIEEVGDNPELMGIRACSSKMMTIEEKIQILSILINKDLRLIRKGDNFGNTVLHHAAVQLTYEIVNLIFPHLGPKSKNAKNTNGLTPLHLLIRSSKKISVDNISKFDLNVVNHDLIHSMHLLAKYRCLEAKDIKSLLTLLPQDFDLNTCRDIFFQTPLHYSAINGNHEFSRELILQGACASAQDLMGNTPLLSALKYGLLMDEVSADSIIIRNNFARNIFHVMAANPVHTVDSFDKLYHQAVEAIGSDEVQKMLGEKDRAGITPLLYAQASGSKIEEAIRQKLCMELEMDDRKSYKRKSPEDDDANAINDRPLKKSKYEIAISLTDQLICDICQQILFKPVIIPSGKVFCKGCITDKLMVIDSFVDSGIETVIQSLLPTSKHVLTYHDHLVENLEYLALQYKKPSLELKKHRLACTWKGGRVTNIYDKSNSPDIPPRLIVFTDVFKDKEELTLSHFHKILSFLSSELTQCGQIHWNLQQRKLFYLVPMTKKDLSIKSALHSTLESSLRFINSIAEHLRSSDALNYGNNQKKALNDPPMQELPGSNGITYSIFDGILLLDTPILNININDINELLKYLSYSDLQYGSFAILKNGQLFRRLHYKVDPQIFPEGVNQEILLQLSEEIKKPYQFKPHQSLDGFAFMNATADGAVAGHIAYNKSANQT